MNREKNIAKIIRRALPLLLVVLLCIGAMSSSVFAEDAAMPAPTLEFADWASSSKISVRWTKVAGAEGYCIYRSRSSDGAFTFVATNKGAENLRAIVSEKRANTGYYKVVAYKTVNKKKVYGAASNVVECVSYKDSNLGYLFPSGPPKSQRAMGKYLTKVRLPIRTAGGKKSYISLRVHKKLKGRVRTAFEEMYKAGFRVRKADTGSYNWRKMRTVNLRSHHSYGCVVDINWKSNPMVKKLSKVKSSKYRPGRDR